MKKKIVAAFLLLSAFALPVSAYGQTADELIGSLESLDPSELAVSGGSDGVSEAFDTDSISALLQNACASMLQTNLSTGSDTSISDYLETGSGLKPGDMQFFDLSDSDLLGSVDLSVLNVSYASMADDLLSSVVDLTGYSQTATGLFMNTYGDLASELSLSTPEIPSDFLSRDMLSVGQAAIESAKQSVLSGDSNFTAVSENIGIGDLVSTVKSGMSSTAAKANGSLSGDDLLSYSEMRSLMSESLSNIQTKAGVEGARNELSVSAKEKIWTSSQQSDVAKVLSSLDASDNLAYQDAVSEDGKSVTERLSELMGRTGNSRGASVAGETADGSEGSSSGSSEGSSSGSSDIDQSRKLGVW